MGSNMGVMGGGAHQNNMQLSYYGGAGVNAGKKTLASNFCLTVKKKPSNNA